jgi:hypothetical protein
MQLRGMSDPAPIRAWRIATWLHAQQRVGCK